MLKHAAACLVRRRRIPGGSLSCRPYQRRAERYLNSDVSSPRTSSPLTFFREEARSTSSRGCAPARGFRNARRGLPQPRSILHQSRGKIRSAGLTPSTAAAPRGRCWDVVLTFLQARQVPPRSGVQKKPVRRRSGTAHAARSSRRAPKAVCVLPLLNADSRVSSRTGPRSLARRHTCDPFQYTPTSARMSHRFTVDVSGVRCRCWSDSRCQDGVAPALGLCLWRLLRQQLRFNGRQHGSPPTWLFALTCNRSLDRHDRRHGAIPGVFPASRSDEAHTACSMMTDGSCGVPTPRVLPLRPVSAWRFARRSVACRTSPRRVRSGTHLLLRWRRK